MPPLPKRFEKIQSVLNKRMPDLTILLENVNKPHNLSAILRTCDAIGVLEAHIVSEHENTQTFNSTAQGSQKWVGLTDHMNITDAAYSLKEKGFKLFGTRVSNESQDYRKSDFTGPTAFVLGAEKWGLSESAIALVDEEIYIPMRGMVQSLNVSVAAAILLSEALRQRELSGIAPENGEGLNQELYKNKIFEWSYPEIAAWCKTKQINYPEMNQAGEICEDFSKSMNLEN